MRILLAVEEAAGLQTLKAVHHSGHEVAAVLTTQGGDATGGMRGATIATLAQTMGYRVLPAKRVKDPLFAEEVRNMRVDILLNVHSLHIVRAQILEVVKLGAFNLHPGPLPEYAGMNVPSWAILNGEKEHGVTLHWMTDGIDGGEIAYQERFDLTERDTGFSVSITCAKVGLQMIGTLLKALHDEPDQIPRVSQDFSKRRYFDRQAPFEGKVQPNMTAIELERFVRASAYFPMPSPIGYPTVDVDGNAVGLMKVSRTHTITEAEAGSIRNSDGVILLAASDEWLAIERVQIEGRAVDANSVLQGGQKLRYQAGVSRVTDR
jgi:methionyl-tRNA formyltransferase